jgi:hypothetical protein
MGVRIRIRHGVARFVVAAYVLAGVLLEVGHHDAHDIVLTPAPVVTGHDCGDAEIHIPLDKRHDCLACVLSSLRLGVIVQTFYSPAEVVSLMAAHVPGDHPLETDILHSGKRGPPIA